MIISFYDILGLEVSDDSIVMDVREIPTMERKIFSSTQHQKKTTGQASDTSTEEKTDKFDTDFDWIAMHGNPVINYYQLEPISI